MPIEHLSDPAPPEAPEQGKFFTLAEANSALPYVARIVEDIATSYRENVELHREITQPDEPDDLDQLKKRYDQAMRRLNDLIEELGRVGVELKDFEKGLIDFPAWHDGRKVCLCWMLGEDQIEAWHEHDAGFQGRQDVSLLGSGIAAPADAPD